ncbi:MAG: hypothetical protein IJY35_13395 [Clostridia bacterium]|nr:hypothetical protein [Clostridia bacterium]
MLPNLVFTPDCEMYRQNGVLEKLPQGTPESSLPDRLLHSLKSGDAAGFRRFCAALYDIDNDSANYAVYPLVGRRFLPFRFAFCEKLLLNETPVTVVYFGDRMGDFHTLMSPSSSFCRDITGMVIHDLLCLRNKFHTNFLTPESLLVFGDFPLIAHAAENTSDDREPYCDLHQLTSRIFESLSDTDALRLTEFILEPLESDPMHPTRLPIVTCPVEAFVYIISLLSFVFSALSDDHRITAQAKNFGQGAEVRFRTRTTRADVFADGTSNAEDFCHSSKHLASLAKIASATAFTFGIRLDFMYDPDTSTLSGILGVGYETMRPPVEFRYSDPYSAVASILREASALFSA